MKRKILSLALVLVMSLGLLTVPAMAEEAAPEAEVPAYTAVIAEKYETWGLLALNNYGTYGVWKQLKAENPDVVLKEGAIVVLPATLGDVARLAEQVVGEGETLYVVTADDTLGKIAAKTYGAVADAKYIQERNADRVKDVNTIFEGQKLVLPDPEYVKAAKELEAAEAKAAAEEAAAKAAAEAAEKKAAAEAAAKEAAEKAAAEKAAAEAAAKEAAEKAAAEAAAKKEAAEKAAAEAAAKAAAEKAAKEAAAKEAAEKAAAEAAAKKEAAEKAAAEAAAKAAADKAAAEAAAAEKAAAEAAAKAEAEAKRDAEAGYTNGYVVEKGDTLSKIALKYYDNANSWGWIYEANKDLIKDPRVINVGQYLYIPGVSVMLETETTDGGLGADGRG